MRVSVETRFAVGDSVCVTPQRLACERSGDVNSVAIGQVTAVQVMWRSSTSFSIMYQCEMATSDHRAGELTSFDETVLEPYEG